jgi:hypothetical protein
MEWFMSMSLCKEMSIPATLAGALISGSVMAGGAVENQEFGFKASIPDGFPICMSHTATHIHGAGTVLIGNDCENRERGPTLGIWVDYNTTFDENALEALRDLCPGGTVGWAEGEWIDAVGGLKTAMCRTDQSDGRITIKLVAQAGKWSDSMDVDDAPKFNYKVYLDSTTLRIDSDLQVFKGFLRSIEIVQVTR